MGGTRLDRPPAVVRLAGAIVLVDKPVVVGEPGARLPLDRVKAERRALETRAGHVRMIAHAQRGPVRPDVCGHAGARVDRVRDRRDVRIAAQELRVRRDKVEIQVRQDLVAGKAADHAHDARHLGVRKRVVQVGGARFRRRGPEHVRFAHILAKRDANAKVREPRVRQLLHVAPGLALLHIGQ